MLKTIYGTYFDSSNFISEIMRQKDEIEFFTALNSLAGDEMTDADVQLFDQER